jgi:hypothetical protein
VRAKKVKLIRVKKTKVKIYKRNYTLDANITDISTVSTVLKSYLLLHVSNFSLTCG